MDMNAYAYETRNGRETGLAKNNDLLSPTLGNRGERQCNRIRNKTG